jgi:hypothetical protein
MVKARQSWRKLWPNAGAKITTALTAPAESFDKAETNSSSVFACDRTHGTSQPNTDRELNKR